MKSVKANFSGSARKHAQRGNNADLLALAGAVRAARARARV